METPRSYSTPRPWASHWRRRGRPASRKAIMRCVASDPSVSTWPSSVPAARKTPHRGANKKFPSSTSSTQPKARIRSSKPSSICRSSRNSLQACRNTPEESALMIVHHLSRSSRPVEWVNPKCFRVSHRRDLQFLLQLWQRSIETALSPSFSGSHGGDPQPMAYGCPFRTLDGGSST